MSKRTKGASVPKPKSDEITKVEAPELEQRREDVRAETGKIELPAELITPLNKESRHYLEAIDAFQEALVKAHSDIRVVRATIPTSYAPEVHIGPHAGFPVATGEVFEVRINTGQIIQPKE